MRTAIVTDTNCGLTAAQAEDGQAQPDSPVLHAADFGVKSRVLLEYKEQAYDICYRRVGKVNELVINGMNLGWETIGTFDHTMEIANLQLISYRN